MDNWQSIVLLTIETPHPVREDVVRRLTRWTGLEFGEAKEASRNFVVLDSRGGMLKLDGDQLFVVTALERPYFASEDIEPYEEQAGFAGDQRMVNLLRTCRGAILIDAHIIQRPYDSLRRLAQIAAAMMAPDTPVMLVPPSAKALAVTGEVRSAMGRAADVAALMPYVMGFHVLEAAGQAVCFTGGMPMLMLPDVMMRCTPGEVEAAAAAVQSLASYMVARRQAVPVGDTMELGPPGGRALRIVPAELGGHSWDPSERIALVPAGGGPGGGPAAPPAQQTPRRTAPPGRPARSGIWRGRPRPPNPAWRRSRPAGSEWRPSRRESPFSCLAPCTSLTRRSRSIGGIRPLSVRPSWTAARWRTGGPRKDRPMTCAAGFARPNRRRWPPVRLRRKPAGSGSRPGRIARPAPRGRTCPLRRQWRCHFGRDAGGSLTCAGGGCPAGGPAA